MKSKMAYCSMPGKLRNSEDNLVSKEIFTCLQFFESPTQLFFFWCSHASIGKEEPHKELCDNESIFFINR